MVAFTTNLNLGKPINGGDADGWGNPLNTNADTLDALLGGVIFGLTLSTAGGSATFGVASGCASGMALGSAYTKTTSAWAVGTAQGALDTGAIANSTWYHVWLIQRTDTGVVDILVSLSATAPTMPTNYTRKRRIGSMKTDGSAHWTAFTQLGDEFLWSSPVLDLNNVTAGVTTALTQTLTVPTGVQVTAINDFYIQPTLTNSAVLYVSSFDVADLAASIVTGAFSAYASSSSPAPAMHASIATRTNTSAQIRMRFASTDTTCFGSTRGWIDKRGNL